MENRYKLIVTNSRLYKEIPLPQGANRYRVGTTTDCESRFAKDRFFADFQLVFAADGESWAVNCSRNVFISDGGIIKLHARQLAHGDELLVRYVSSNQPLFKLSFMLDFEAEKADYSRVIDMGRRSRVTLGKSRNCDVVLNDPLLAEDVIILEREEDALYIVDNGTRYGVYLNGVRVERRAEVLDMDFFSILGFSFYYKQGELYTSLVMPLYLGESMTSYEVAEQTGHLLYPCFNRNTRVKTLLPTEEIQVLDPPAKPEKPKSNLLTSLLPSVAMIALVVLMRGGVIGGTAGAGGGNLGMILYSAGAMGIGAVTTVIGLVSGKKDYKEGSARRIQEYNDYIARKRQEIEEARDNEKRLLQRIYISPEQEEVNVQSFCGDLFDRCPASEDFLHVRLGIGKQTALRPVGYKPKETITVDDDLADCPRQLYEEYREISGAPVVLKLADANAVGVYGPDESLLQMMTVMITDICTRQYHDDVRIYLIVESELMERLRWTRWLRHINNEQLRIRNIACDAESRTTLFEYLYSEILHRQQEKRKTPHLVVFIYNNEAFKRHPISKFVSQAGEVGVSMVFLDHFREEAPLSCTQLIQLEEHAGLGALTMADGSIEDLAFQFQPLRGESVESLAVKLAPVYCEDISLESALTKSITFYEMLGILSTDDIDLGKSWGGSNIVKSMAAPVGVKSGNELVYLDLHEKAHGPHGLVAGTTGSGKSEALQTYILSMATLFHPYEVGFVIIDFKGGGMANQFRELPHLVGAITNIDGREIDRSLKSIKAELQKRQRLFAEAEVNSIGNYIKLFKAGKVTTPLPHLIIVVDEFAELKAEQPEFMKELISAARIGRSLGVHLILATQKPSGQVNEQIWSNSRFKLCLKVQNAQDSNEVLKSPLAAEIKEPGRAYLQVGNNEIFELFQSAYSGAPSAVSDPGTQKEYDISVVSLTGRRQPVFKQRKKKMDSGAVAQNQLEAVVEYVQQYCEKNHIPHLPSICLPALPDMLPYPTTGQAEANGAVEIWLGLYDDPDSQYQGIAGIRLAGENTLIIGSSQMGKTNLLQVILREIAESYSPDEVSVYIVDFGAMSLRNFEKLAHVGGVITATEEERFKNLFKLLSEEIEGRKKKLSDIGLSSFSAYREAGYTDLPLLVLMLDNFNVFKELYAENYEAALIYLMREGQTYGITAIITNTQTSGLGFRYMSNIGNRIALTCNDRGEYANIIDRCRIEPKNTPGRALFVRDKSIYEFQSYLGFQGEKEIDRVNAIRAFISAANKQYPGKAARQIPSIPESVSISYIRQNYPQADVTENINIALDYNTIECVGISCYRQFLLAVAGKNAAGRQMFLRTLMSDIKINIFRRPVKLYIIDNFQRTLSACKDDPYTEEYTVSADGLTGIIEAVAEELTQRYETLEDEGTEALRKMPWIIVIVNNKQALDTMASSRQHETIFGDISKKYSDLKILFLLTDVTDASVSSSAPAMLRRVKEDKKLLYFGAIKEMKLIDLYGAAARGLGPLISGDDAYLLNGENTYRVKTIQEV